jgi:hypothetical protein
LSLLSDVGWEKELSRLGRGCVVKRRARDSILFPLSLSYDSLLTLKLTAFQVRLLIRHTQKCDSSSLEKNLRPKPNLTSLSPPVTAFLLLPLYLTRTRPPFAISSHPTTKTTSTTPAKMSTPKQTSKAPNPPTTASTGCTARSSPENSAEATTPLPRRPKARR